MKANEIHYFSDLFDKVLYVLRTSPLFIIRSISTQYTSIGICHASSLGARLIQMCLTETYSRVRVGKNLSEMFPIRNGLKQGDALSPLLFNFALEYAIKRV